MKRFLRTLWQQTKGNVEKWEDLFTMYEALYNPYESQELINKILELPKVEEGNTKSFTLWFLQAIGEFGEYNPDIKANTYSYAVFDHKNGNPVVVRNYIVYNAKSAPVTVTFSDGKTVECAPISLTHDTKEYPRTDVLDK